MRCLYCGKHLPLLRKLTGGGEFCSDAHRDKYHEEYNRLAVSRLLQAQTRPEDVRPAAQPEPPSQTQAPPAVVALEPVTPQAVELPGSFIEKFSLREIRPAVPEKTSALAVGPMFLREPEITLPCTEPIGLLTPGAAEFITTSPAARRTPFAPLAAEPASLSSCGAALPAIPEARHREYSLAASGAVAFGELRPPKGSRTEPVALKLAAIEPSLPTLAMPSSPAFQYGGGVAITSPVRLVLEALPSDDCPALEFAQLLEFSRLLESRPQFDPALCLAAMDAAGGYASTDTIPEIPAPEFEQDPRPQQPRTSLNFQQIVISPVAPAPGMLTTGFDTIEIPARPGIFEYGAQPLRPKLVLEPAAAAVPGPRPPAGSRRGAARSAQAGAPKILPRSILAIEDTAPQDGPKLTPRSMLHLDEDLPAESEAPPEGGTLLGKLGGLFGRKNKS